MRLYDAHNHLQDERFEGRQPELVSVCRVEGVVGMVVNGACESDWPEVERLARCYPDLVRPSFGYHPWYLGERTQEWQATLLRYLETVPGAVVGEIGLDRWKPGLPYADQEEAFLCQMRLASERGIPASIHCLQAWGRLFELLRAGPRPACGFLLHSYGGPVEMVAPLAKLGAYFSLPGYFAHERKHRQRAAFRAVPRDRLLIETDAPDQSLPRPDPERAEGQAGGEAWGRERHALRSGPAASPINHAANLKAVYEFGACLLGEPLPALADQVEANFLRLFGVPGGAREHASIR